MRPNYNWARWYPELVPGRYEVFVQVPEHYATTSQARDWISHRDSLTLRVVDQAANRGKWVSLGIYRSDGVCKSVENPLAVSPREASDLCERRSGLPRLTGSLLRRKRRASQRQRLRRQFPPKSILYPWS